jgi:hypothetical protein
MSISAMKQALEALEEVQRYDKTSEWFEKKVFALRQAIAEAEKQEPVAIGEEWKPCVKLPIVVHVREQRKGETHVSTREGITPVKEDDLIMRGVAGEEYPIGRELFNRTYTFDTSPVHAIDISQERVDETAKQRHECPEWDFMEIDKDSPEFDACLCFPKPSLWLAIAQDGRVKYTTDSCRASDWKKSGSYRLVRDYYTAPPKRDLTCVCGAVWDGEQMVHAPPKREWVGLTDDEIKDIWGEPIDCMYSGHYWAIRDIEAKLKEKNSG